MNPEQYFLLMHDLHTTSPLRPQWDSNSLKCFTTAPHPRGSGNGRFDRRGSGEDGKLGMGDWEEDWAHRIQFLEPKNVVAVVAAASRNSLAICVDGQVNIAGGGWHSAALTDDGEVYARGSGGEHGRLGRGGDSKIVPEKVQLLVGANIVQDLVEALTQWHMTLDDLRIVGCIWRTSLEEETIGASPLLEEGYKWLFDNDTNRLITPERPRQF